MSSSSVYQPWSTADDEFKPPVCGNSPPPAWDTEPAPWDQEGAFKLAKKLLLLDISKDEKSNEVTFDKDLKLNRSEVGTGGNPRFKTEFCRNFREKGFCVYGEQCQFAHGRNELRPDIVKHSKYKTKMCSKFWINGYCAYGPRCNFIHIDEDGAPFPNRAGGLRPPPIRKSSESSEDSGIDQCVGRRPLKAGGEWKDSGLKRSPPVGGGLMDLNRLIRGETLGRRESVPHPEHNPIPAMGAKDRAIPSMGFMDYSAATPATGFKDTRYYARFEAEIWSFF